MNDSGTTAGVTTTPSYCRICEPLCGILVDVVDGRVTSVRGDPEHPSSRGYLCPKGASMPAVVNDPDRVLRPLRGDRRGNFIEVTWDEALDDIAARLQGIIDRDGPDAIAYYSGNPAGFGMAGHMASKRFLDRLGSKGSYSAAPQDTSSRWAACHYLYGNTHATVIPDIASTDFFLCLGANPLVTHGSLLSIGRIRDAMNGVVERGGRVVIVDPARTKTARAFEHLQIRPDTDVWLLASMLRTIFERGLEARNLDDQAVGAQVLREFVEPFTPELASRETGLDPAVIERLAIDFAEARTACSYGRLGVCRGEQPTLTNYLLDALSIVTGNLDVRGGLVFGYGLVDFPAVNAKTGRASIGNARTRIGGLPEVGGRKPWVMAEEILTPGPGQVKAVFTMAGNPVASTPGARTLKKAFEQLELLVCVDLYAGDTAMLADYVLPPPTFLERRDIMLSFGGGMPRPWVHYTEPAVPRIGDTREEDAIFGALLQRLGIPDEPPVWDLIESMINESERAQQEGWTFDRIRAHPHGVELGGDVPVGVLHERLRSVTAGQRTKVELGVVEVLSQLDEILERPKPPALTLRLIGRRDLRTINSWMHNIRPRRPSSAPRLHMHPADAATRGIGDGDQAVVETSLGTLVVPVEITEDIVRGAVSYPHGWGSEGRLRNAARLEGVNINLIVPNDVASKDRHSGMSRLDGVEVLVRRWEPASRHGDLPGRTGTRDQAGD